MKLCNDTITVFNKRWDAENGWEVYCPTVIQGVSWYSTIAVNVADSELVAANQIIVRIPVDANFGGSTYVDPVAYRNAESPDGLFTLANGDIIVKASVAVAPLTPAQLKESFTEYCTILGVTDDRRAPNAPHFKVVGK